jgi:hypothetical protein
MLRPLAGLCSALYQLTKIRAFSNMSSALYRMGRVGDAADSVRRSSARDNEQRQRQQDRRDQ